MDLLNRILIKELEVLELGSKIQSQVQSEVGKNQREHFLREQLKAIQKELGEGDEQAKEIEELAEDRSGGMPDTVKKEALRELDRLSKMPVAAAEYTVSRTYVDWLGAAMGKRHRRSHRAQTDEVVLDADHSIWRRRRIASSNTSRPQAQSRSEGADLPLLGPPGVGKTSLARSIAHRSTASSSASRSAVCATRPRFAATGEHTSARCRADHPGLVAPSPRTRSSSWTRSTSSDQISAAIPRRLCSKVLDPSRTTRSAIITSTCRSTCRGALHHDGERAGYHPAASPRPHGGARASWLHGRGES